MGEILEFPEKEDRVLICSRCRQSKFLLMEDGSIRCESCYAEVEDMFWVERLEVS